MCGKLIQSSTNISRFQTHLEYEDTRDDYAQDIDDGKTETESAQNWSFDDHIVRIRWCVVVRSSQTGGTPR